MKRHRTEADKQRAAERREKFKALWKQVAAMPDLECVQLANKLGIVTCEGTALSYKNQCLLALQCPNVSVVGGFRQWLKQGRCVRKGEHGHMLWVPTFGKNAEPDTTPADGESGEAPERRFIIGTVFDVSQTDEIVEEKDVDLTPDEELLAALA